MCTAQVLLLNRDVMRRNFGNEVNRRVCRKLFDADPNPAGPGMFLKKMQEEIRKRDSERWNFDFFNETPLPGRYQWEPTFTTKPIVRKETTTPESNLEERVQQDAAAPIVEEIRRETPSTQTKKKAGAGAASQPKITAFMTKKRRSNTEESSSSKLKLRRISRSNESLTTRTRLR